MPFFPQFSNLFVPPYVPPPSPPAAGKILWLKADVGVNYDGNNLVTSWEDQSGNANNVTPYDSGYEPLWVDSSINGLPSIRFLHETDPSLLVTPNIFSVNYDTPASLIAVAMAVNTEVSSGDAQRWLLPDGSSGTFELGFTFGHYNSVPRYFSSMIGRNLIGEEDMESSQIVDTEVAIVSLINDGATVSFYKNGSLEGTLDPADFDNATASSGVWGIGAQMASGSVYLAARFNLAELMIYNTSIDTTERETQEAYLNDKWAVY